MPPKKPSMRKSKQRPKYPESTGKNPCGNTASTQIGLAIERPVAPSRLTMQPPAVHTPQPVPHSAQSMGGPPMAPYVQSLRQGLSHIYDMGPSMTSHVQSQQHLPQMNPPSRDMMAGPSMIPCAPFLPQMAPQIPPSNQQLMAGPSTIPRTPFPPQIVLQIPISNQQSIAGPSTIPRTPFPPQIVPQIPISNQQSIAGPSTIQWIPSQSATPLQYQSRMQTPALNVEGVHQAIETYRPGLRMRTDHNNALVRIPSVRAASRAAPYEAYRLVMAYAKPRPGELVRGEEFSTGVICVVPGSSRAVRKPIHPRLPPVEPIGTGHIAQPGLGSSAISGQPLMSNSTQPPQLSSVTISRIVDSARNAFRRDFLSNLMVASNDLKDMAQRAFNQGVEAHSSSSTMDSADAWVVESQKTELKKLRTIPNTIQSIFKDVGRSAVDLALPISEQNKELVHQKAYIDSLCIDFAYLDDPDTNAAFGNPALFCIISRVLHEKRLSRWIDPSKRDLNNIIAFSGTILFWALQEHANGSDGKSEFVVEDNRTTFDSILQRLDGLLLSERAAVDKLIDDIFAEMQ